MKATNEESTFRHRSPGESNLAGAFFWRGKRQVVNVPARNRFNGPFGLGFRSELARRCPY